MSEFSDRVKRGLEGLEHVSTGLCPGCETCAKNYGMPLEDFKVEYDALTYEGGFSWRPCGICGNELGGNREVWHAIMDGEIRHYPNACIDCVVYLANGDEPEEQP
jgi:hypothetical protein